MVDNMMTDNRVKIEKIKAIRPQIIVTGTVEKPYYGILYFDTSDNVWHIGYSSYILANVIKWKEECFEVVGEIEDMQPTADVVEVKHGEWKRNERNIPKMREFHEKGIALSMSEKSIFYTCSCCGSWGTLTQNYCPNCGAKMDGGNVE